MKASILISILKTVHPETEVKVAGLFGIPEEPKVQIEHLGSDYQTLPNHKVLIS